MMDRRDFLIAGVGTLGIGTVECSANQTDWLQPGARATCVLKPTAKSKDGRGVLCGECSVSVEQVVLDIADPDRGDDHQRVHGGMQLTSFVIHNWSHRETPIYPIAEISVTAGNLKLIANVWLSGRTIRRHSHKAFSRLGWFYRGVRDHRTSEMGENLSTVRITVRTPRQHADVWRALDRRAMPAFREAALIETVVVGLEDSQRRGWMVRDTTRFYQSFVPVKGEGRSDAGNRFSGKISASVARRKLKGLNLRRGASIVNRARKPGQRRSYAFAPFGGRRRARNGRMIGSLRHRRPMGPAIQRTIKGAGMKISRLAFKAAARKARGLR